MNAASPPAVDTGVVETGVGLCLSDGGYRGGIRTDIADYGLESALFPYDVSLRLAAVPTRLARMPATVQERLVNWGYAVSDAALRRHVDPGLAGPVGLPYPAAGFG